MYLQIALKDAVEPPKDKVFNQVLAGTVEIVTDLSSVERRQKVFGFIAGESKQMIAAQVKQLVVGMDNRERNHYEQKVAKLDEEIELAQKRPEQRVTIEQLMRGVGLSPSLGGGPKQVGVDNTAGIF